MTDITKTGEMKMNKLATITISGGFHNSQQINIRLPLRTWAQIMQGMDKMAALSPSQEKRINKHFCGIPGCLCGGASRAEWRISSHSVVPA